MAIALGEARKDLSADALFRSLRSHFGSLPDPRSGEVEIPLDDALMSAFAMFSLKDPSLLAFDDRRRDPNDNFRSIYGISRVPSDSQMRAVLDPVDPAGLRAPFREIFRRLQRGKALKRFVYLDGHYLVSLDGTTYFSSAKIHCPSCLVKQHRNGNITYSHQLLGATLVHPDLKEVIPLAPEPIIQQDGQAKNDCERNATRRWLKRFRQEHPHLPVIVVEDALAPTPPTFATCVRLARITSLASSRATTRFCSTTCGPSTRPARCRSLPWRIQRRALCIIFGSVMACRSTSRTPTSWSMCWNTGRSTPMERCSISVGSPTFS